MSLTDADGGTQRAAGSFLVATWNVNSLRARIERVTEWLTRVQPDVVCLQEIKAQDADFPRQAIEDLGYFATIYGQKAYNGVALLTRRDHGEPQDVLRGLDDGDSDAEARLISATIPSLQIRVGSVYVPQGQELASEKFAYKLRFLERLHKHVAQRYPSELPAILGGDYNVAPADADVYDPKGWKDTVICHPSVREAFQRLLHTGLSDTVRALEPDATLYTYWDYRSLSFPKNNGLRIDHLLATQPLLARCQSVRVDRDARKGEKPSDHAPVIAQFLR